MLPYCLAWLLMTLPAASSGSDGETGIEMFRLKEFVNCIAFSRDGKYLGFGTEQGTLEVWDFQKRNKVASFRNQEGNILSINFHPSLPVVLFGGARSRLNLFDYEKGKLLWSEVIDVPIRALSIRSGAHTLAIGGVKNKLGLFDFDSRRIVYKPLPKDMGSSTLVFGNEEKVLYIALWDLNVKSVTAEEPKLASYIIATGTIQQLPITHTAMVTSLAVSKEGDILVSGSIDQTVKCYSIRRNEMLCSLNHKDFVFSVDISADGSRIASAGADGNIKVWDLKSSKLLDSFGQERYYAAAVVISPDGRFVVGGFGSPDESTGLLVVKRISKDVRPR